jgi:phospholipid-binding lipoprotein MlaA
VRLRLARLAGGCGLALWFFSLWGCSALPRQEGPVLPAREPVSQFVKPGREYVIEVYDPWETFNRSVYNFNALVDWYVLLPVVQSYENLTPIFLQDRVSAFFSNVSDIRNLLNSLLQLKGEQTLRTVARLVFNTTFGILGLWDPATAVGIAQQQEDFGQTLGYYGIGDGPYLVLPVDTASLTSLDPLDLQDHPGARVPYFTLNVIDTRHKIDFRYYETGSPFEYDLVRLLYTKARQLQIER